MNLEEMYKRTAKYVDENIGEPPYTGELIDRFKSSINYAYQKICKEKLFPETSEDVTLDNNLQFDVSALSNAFNGIIDVKDSNGCEVTYENVRGNTKIRCPHRSQGDVVTVVYRYVPAQLEELTDEPAFSEAEVDHLLLCYYAAYDYFVIEEERERAEDWLGRWAEGYSAISQSSGGEADEYW